MEPGDYKIKVNSEAESKEAQELFFELGYDKKSVSGHYPNWISNFEYLNGRVERYTSEPSESWLFKCKELTIPQLRDFVVLHRNDVKDANYTCSGKPVLKLDTQDYKVWDSKNNTWTEHAGSQTDLRKGIKPTQPEQCLISGADALRALADGKEVELQVNGDVNWHDSTQWTVGELLAFKGAFRLKPRTIKLNIEIPAPFEPKVDEKYWFIADYVSSGYSDTQEGTGINSSIGKWRTEEEIKQVVSALRGALKNG